ncbi:hypothetical protein LTR85_006054 [Meristemomyces frigidus]|nr:hypothetical protein LTR85_006054 [Meristemomyces frigidus]
MAAWDDTPAAASGDAWQAHGGAGSDDGFTADTSGDNISKHANGDFGDAPQDGGCRICHADGHFARDCPEKGEGGGGENSGECYNCGEMGHNKADCPNPAVEREFTGACHFCSQTGHRASECPEKPAETCKVCKQEGHVASDCSVNRMFANFADLGIKDMSAEDAWKELEAADKDKDVDDIKKAILTYAKAFAEVTFEELEQTFRDAEMNTYLIAKQQEVSDTHTIINLQGKIDQEYVVSIQFSAKPRRAKFAEGWPESPEENLTRLGKAGLPMDRMVPKCSNCDQLGHTARACTEEKVEREKQAIECANCNNQGHRARDCPEPRKSGKRGCKNCGVEGHIAKECPEPRNPDTVECRNCGTMGHFSSDCPDREPDICRNCHQEGHRAKDCPNERVMKCRNCDELGHASRECPKPTDWSRVECSNCKEKGHSYKRCKNPPAEVEGDGDAGGDASGGGSWEAGGSAPAAASGGGDAWGAGGGDAAPATDGGGW